MQDRTINDTNLTIGTTSQVVSQAIYGSTRVVISLQNISTGGQTISIAWGKDAEVNKGIVLGAGQSYILSKDAGYTPSDSQITAISNGANAILALHEEIQE